MKREIIFAIAGFVGGVAVGAGTAVAIQKVKEKKTKNRKPLLTKDLPKEEDPQPYIEITADELKDELTKAINIAVNEGYMEVDPAETEFPKDDDPEDEEEEELKESIQKKEEIEEYREKNKGRIIPISEEEYYSEDEDLPDESPEREELYYFPDEYLLVDEDNRILEPISTYCGKICDAYNREQLPKLIYGSNTQHVSTTDHFIVVYIRNFPMDRKLKVSIPVKWYKDLDLKREVFDLITRDEFFGDYEEDEDYNED